MKKNYWNPYFVGAGIGVLSWLVFTIVNNPIGMTTALSQVAGASAELVAGTPAGELSPYWIKHAPAWNYGTLFLIGVFFGALVSSYFGGTFKIEHVPTVWQSRFGASKNKRYFWAFVGGILAMYGARLAGGCTSGHGISGSLQLALSSWIFFITMFISGLITAKLLFKKQSDSGA